MAVSEDITLSLSARPAEGSRAARRLRREGRVPGVLYGTGAEPQAFAVDARELRNRIQHGGAVVEVSLDGGKPSPVLIKDLQRHPVRGEVTHVDLLRVRMDQTIHTTVSIELTGADDAPGVKEGGILTQELRELNIEALPGDIPDSITHDVSELELNATLLLESLSAPRGVTLLDDPETVVATITPPTAEPVEEEIETETEVLADGAVESAEAQAQAEGATADEAEAADES